MGSCLNRSLETKEQSLPQMPENEWSFPEDRFDISTFKRSISEYHSNAYQQILKKLWAGQSLSPRSSKKSESPARLSKSTLKQFASLIAQGVPYHLIKDLILTIIPFCSSTAKKNFVSHLEACENQPDFECLRPTEDPIFGRKNLQNIFLTTFCINRCKRTLFLLKHLNPKLSVCILLPRATQLFFWFLEDFEAFSVISVLIKESQAHIAKGAGSLYFFNDSEGIVMYVGSVMKMLDQKSELLSFAIEDAFYNMLIGFISPAYYPVVLMNFFVEGIQGLARMIFALFSLILSSVNQITSKDPDNFLGDLKALSRETISIIALLNVIIIKKTLEVDLGLFSGIFESLNTHTTLLRNFMPVFKGTSNILNNTEEMCVFREILPMEAIFNRLELKFSLGASGFDTVGFYASLNAFPLIILIETSKKAAFGIYLDFQGNSAEATNASTFSIRPKSRVYLKTDFTIKLSIESHTNQYFQLLENNSPIFVIYSSLTDGRSCESKAFSSPPLAKKPDFGINNLEIFHVT